MGKNSKIEWTDATWNPITGCTKISEGCKNCYAERMSKRLAGRYGYPTDEPFKVTLHYDKLNQPLHWRKPRKIFVCSMSDLFHPQVPLEFQLRILKIIKQCPQHIFQILTKRPEQIEMLDYVGGIEFPPNVWLGVSAENQERADERIPSLLRISAVVRFVSAEPLIGPIDFLNEGYLGYDAYVSTMETPDRTGVKYVPGIDWVIAGGESGPNARPMHPQWVRAIRNQCIEGGTAFYLKQWGEWKPFDDHTNAMLSGGSLQITHDGSIPSGLNPSTVWMSKVGKKRAGRLLDGIEWNEEPNDIK